MLPSKYRLCKNIEFRRIYRNAKSIANPYLVMYFKRNGLSESRIGFSISKKIGKANERNYLKRQMREVVRHNLNSIKSGYDLIFIARQKIKGISYSDVEKNIKSLLVKGRLINDK